MWIAYAGQYWDEIPPPYYLLPLQINLQHVCFFHVHLGRVTLSFLSLDLTDPEYSHCIFRDTIVLPSDKSILLWIFYFRNCPNKCRHHLLTFWCNNRTLKMVSLLFLSSSIVPNSSFNALAMHPGLFGCPTMVYVFPLPVAP